MEVRIDIDYLERLIRVLKDHDYLWKYPIKNFFTSKVYSMFLEKWSLLTNISEEQLLKLPYDDELRKRVDYINFFENAQTLSILQSTAHSSNHSSLKELPKHLFLKMKKKKEYEIRQVLPLLIQECKKLKIKTIIDVGCGAGNLIKILIFCGFKCIGIEANEELCKTARENNPSANILHSFVTSESLKEVETLAQAYGPAALVSLHGCGDLQKTILSIKAGVDPVILPLLFTFGCCYHKRSNETINDWAISETVKSRLAEANLELTTSALRLACDRGLLQWSNQTAAQLGTLKDAIFNRAIIEVVFPNETCQRNTNRKLSNDLISSICEKHDVPSEERNIKEQELNLAFETFAEYKRLILPFTMLQSSIQGPMETLILLDAAYYLIERGIATNIAAAFNVLQSPRNMCLICSSV